MKRIFLTLAFATAIAVPASAQIRFDFGGDDRGGYREHRGDWREHRSEWSGERRHDRCRWVRDEYGEPVRVCRR